MVLYHTEISIERNTSDGSFDVVGQRFGDDVNHFVLSGHWRSPVLIDCRTEECKCASRISVLACAKPSLCKASISVEVAINTSNTYYKWEFVFICKSVDMSVCISGTCPFLRVSVTNVATKSNSIVEGCRCRCYIRSVAVLLRNLVYTCYRIAVVFEVGLYEAHVLHIAFGSIALVVTLPCTFVGCTAVGIRKPSCACGEFFFVIYNLTNHILYMGDRFA